MDLKTLFFLKFTNGVETEAKRNFLTGKRKVGVGHVKLFYINHLFGFYFYSISYKAVEIYSIIAVQNVYKLKK